MGETVEHFFVQALVALFPVERLNEAVLLRFASRDIVPGDAGLLLPFQDVAREVSSVPLSETIVFGLPQSRMQRSSSWTTRAPDREVSATSARHSRV